MSTSNAPSARSPAQRAVDALSNVLPRSATVSVEDQHTSSAHTTINDRLLHVAWGGEGWLRNIRPLLDEEPEERPDIVAARRMSPGARNVLSQMGIGWVDESGAAEIAVDSILVSRSGLPVKPSQTSDRWTPSVFAVAEALLCGVRATVKATREATGLSTGSCVRALQLLEDLDLLVSDVDRGRNSGRRVDDSGALLDVYASKVAALKEPKSLQVGVTWRDPVAGLVEAGRAWDDVSTDWACTGIVAASVMAPHLTSETSATVYVDGTSLADLEAAATDVGLRPIDGGRLTLRTFPTVTTRRFVERLDGLKVTAWPRVYADLCMAGVRGEEAAEHLREVVRGR